MTSAISDVVFSPTVKGMQERLGSRRAYARREEKGGWSNTLTDELVQFIAARDSLYLATANASGQPYIQHRGGPPGFLAVIDPRTLAFADFSGNRQYISIGNLSENDRVHLFLMDYANRRRVKIWGRARVVDDDAALTQRVAIAGYAGRIERVLVITVEAWDINCPQHIPPRFGLDEVQAATAHLQSRIRALESALAASGHAILPG
jgi:hypothetical protein